MSFSPATLRRKWHARLLLQPAGCRCGEVRSDAYIDIQETARRVIRQIGYDRSELRFDGDSCGILSAIHEQSADINQGVVRDDVRRQGAATRA